MTLDEQLDALEAEVLAPGRSPQQREAARESFELLISQGIREAIGGLEEGTAVYRELTQKLQAIIDKIRNNRIPDVIGEANNFVAAVNAAAQGNANPGG